jgi:hypothetical protein
MYLFLGILLYYVSCDEKKVHIDELCNLQSSLNVIRMTKSRSMKWAGHLGHMGRSSYNVLVGRPHRK